MAATGTASFDDSVDDVATVSAAAETMVTVETAMLAVLRSVTKAVEAV